MTSDDAKFVDDFCQEKKISPLNTRLFKDKDGNFDLRICSWKADKTQLPYLGDHEFRGKKIAVTAADFSKFMDDVVQSMSHAAEYAADATQKGMCIDYKDHFQFGE